MKVILLQDIYKQGVAGEVIEVADGYARNFLIPTGRAAQATRGAIKSHEHLSAQVAARRAAYENKLNEVARLIDKTELFFERRAASTGKLFGSVTTQEIADALYKASGVDINRRRITVAGLRDMGRHEIHVRIGSEFTPTLICYVLREGELKEFLAKREAEKNAGVAAAEAAALEAATAPAAEAPVAEAASE